MSTDMMELEFDVFCHAFSSSTYDTFRPSQPCIVPVTGLQTHVGSQVWVAWVQVQVCHDIPVQNPHPAPWVWWVFPGTWIIKCHCHFTSPTTSTWPQAQEHTWCQWEYSFSWVPPDFLFFRLFQLSWVRIIIYAISLIVKLIGLFPLHLDLIRKGILSKANCLGLNLSMYERIYVKIYRSTSL